MAISTQPGRKPPAGRFSIGDEVLKMAITDEQLAEMHRFLAEYHRGLAKQAALDVMQQYHADLAQRLADEAALIPRRTAIAQRLQERERHAKEDGE